MREQRWVIARQNLSSWRGLGLLLLTLLTMVSFAISIAEWFGLVDRYLSDQYGTSGWAAFGMMFGVVGVSKHWRRPQQARLVRRGLFALCCGSSTWAILALLKPMQIPNNLLDLAIILLMLLSLKLQVN